jgi:hypothetical protein
MTRLALLALVLAALTLRCPGATNFYTLLTNGPAANRMNVTFLSEGYQTNQMGAFLADATNAMNSLLGRAPFSEYPSYFNFFAIAVPSVDEGSDDPSQGLTRNTFFNTMYYGDVIFMPPYYPPGLASYFDTNYSHGQGKVDTLLAKYMPGTRLPVLLVNYAVLGGAGGQNALSNSLAICNNYYTSLNDVLPHEVGHTLADLDDESDYSFLQYNDEEKPNSTRETNRTLIKWRTWIEPTTPVPTPVEVGDDVVGLFEGAHYQPTNWYRPQLNCLMRNVAPQPFCKVCAEALVLSCYRVVRPVDSFLPATNSLRITNTQPQTFSVSVLHPGSHLLRVQWYTNNVAVRDATNSTLVVSPSALGNGSNRVRVVVRDDTGLVRNDPTNLLSQTVAWSVNVAYPDLRLTNLRWLGTNRFGLTVAGVAPQGFSIHGLTNLSLTNWFVLFTNYPGSNLFTYNYTNTTATNTWRFFKARTPPGP